MFIGTHEIEKTEVVDGFVNIIFKDGLDLRIKEDLFDVIKKEESSEGSYVDVISFHFAKKFIAELALNEMSACYLDTISIQMSNLTGNLIDELLDNTFGGRGGRKFIPLHKIMPK